MSICSTISTFLIYSQVYMKIRTERYYCVLHPKIKPDLSSKDFLTHEAVIDIDRKSSRAQ